MRRSIKLLWATSECESRTKAAQPFSIDRDLAAGTWQVVLGSDGRPEWVETGPEGRRMLTGEPGASFARRVGAKLLSWLPIEGLL